MIKSGVFYKQGFWILGQYFKASLSTTEFEIIFLDLGISW